MKCWIASSGRCHGALHAHRFIVFISAGFSAVRSMNATGRATSNTAQEATRTNKRTATREDFHTATREDFHTATTEDNILAVAMATTLRNPPRRASTRRPGRGPSLCKDPRILTERHPDHQTAPPKPTPACLHSQANECSLIRDVWTWCTSATHGSRSSLLAEGRASGGRRRRWLRRTDRCLSRRAQLSSSPCR